MRKTVQVQYTENGDGKLAEFDAGVRLDLFR